MAEKKKTSNQEKEDLENKPSELELLKKQLEETEAKAEEFKDKWMRSVAEFDNYKKRNAKIWQDAYNEGSTEVLMKILPIGDNLDFALSMELDEKTHEGLVNIKKKYDETLNSLGVTEINPTGQFDPMFAEAVMQAEGDEGEESGSVKQVFQKGYKLKDKIIRYAKVSVVK